MYLWLPVVETRFCLAILMPLKIYECRGKGVVEFFLVSLLQEDTLSITVTPCFLLIKLKW